VAELGLSKLSAGLIASANFAGYLVGALLAATSGIAGSAVLVSLLSAAGQSWSMLWLASGLVSVFGTFADAQMIPAEAAAATAKRSRSAPVIGRRLLVRFRIHHHGDVSRCSRP
jgi:hypothetical protein